MRRILIIATVLLLGAGWLGAGDHDEHHPTVVDDPRFEFLERLEGRWTSPAEGEMPAGVFEFRVTAGGTAIEEREMIGTPMEMLTVYSMDGANLVGTHFCVLGNQPRVVAAETVVDGTLTFACNGKPGNAESHAEEHVHGWSMRFDGAGRLHYFAELVRDGSVTEAPALVLTRQEQTARR